MGRKRIALTGILMAMTAIPTAANAAMCSIKAEWFDNAALGDSLYGRRVCNQSHISRFWRDFHFDKGDWDDGFGYYSVCNINSPLNRTFSALWLLLFSSPNPATAPSDFTGNFLRYAYNYSAREIDELDGRCGNRRTFGTVAQTVRGGWWVDDRTELMSPFFYGKSVPERAGTIVHEARHADGWSHHSCSCPRRTACDRSWFDYHANTYGILYMWWFIDSGVNTTSAMKRRAQYRVNNVLAEGFCTPTSFRLRYLL